MSNYSLAPPVTKSKDLVPRGVKKRSVAGTVMFIGLRALDPLLQYQILANGLGSNMLIKLSLSTVPLSNALVAQTGIITIDNHTLSLPSLILLGMSIGAVVKQIFWQTYLSNEEFPPGTAVFVSAYNSIANSFNSLLFLASATSSSLSTSFSIHVSGTSAPLPLPVSLGTILYVVGILLEAGSELQRKWFKDSPENKGKICTTGLWSWARHINYGGYILWRGGYALAAGGFMAGLAVAAVQAIQLVLVGIDSLDYYMANRYREQWTEYKQKVKWLLLPGIY